MSSSTQADQMMTNLAAKLSQQWNRQVQVVALSSGGVTNQYIPLRKDYDLYVDGNLLTRISFMVNYRGIYTWNGSTGICRTFAKADDFERELFQCHQHWM